MRCEICCEEIKEEEWNTIIWGSKREHSKCIANRRLWKRIRAIEKSIKETQ